MNKYKIAVPIILIVFSTYSSAFLKVSSNFEHQSSESFQSFKEYKDYRIEQLNYLKINGIVDKMYIDSEIKKLQTFEVKYRQLEISKINNLNSKDSPCSFKNNLHKLDELFIREKTLECINN